VWDFKTFERRLDFLNALGVKPSPDQDDFGRINFIVWSKFVIKPKQRQESTSNLNTALIMQESSPDLVQKIM
jgi:hypothetical protein